MLIPFSVLIAQHTSNYPQKRIPNRIHGKNFKLGKELLQTIKKKSPVAD